MMLRGLAFNPKILHFSPSLPLFSLNSPSFSSRLPSFSGLSHSPSVYFFCMYWPFGWFCGKFRKRRENRKFCVCCYPFLKRKTSYFLCQFVGLWSVEWRVLFQLITKENSSIQSFKFGFFFFFPALFIATNHSLIYWIVGRKLNLECQDCCCFRFWKMENHPLLLQSVGSRGFSFLITKEKSSIQSFNFVSSFCSLCQKSSSFFGCWCFFFFLWISSWF